MERCGPDATTPTALVMVYLGPWAMLSSGAFERVFSKRGQQEQFLVTSGGPAEAESANEGVEVKREIRRLDVLGGDSQTKSERQASIQLQVQNQAFKVRRERAL